MNKKLKFIVAGVAIVAGLASAVSCQDLSKDVEDLGKRVSTLENTVKDLQTKIDAGAVITSVTSTATGVKVTLSNGNSFDLTNGKDGANGTNGKDGKDGKDGVDGTPGSVVTIGENGNWFIDGVDTGLAVAGKDGKDGEDGDSIVWAIEDGKFVEYKNGVATGNTKEIAGEGVLKAVWDAENGVLTLYGAEGAEDGLPIVIYNNASAAAAVSLIDSYTGWYYYFDRAQGNISRRSTTNPYYYDATTGIYTLLTGPAGEDVYVDSYSQGAPALNIIFTNVIEKANKFGPKGELVFEEGRQTALARTFLIRVSPANYEVKAEDIKFVNALGEAFDQVEVNVEPADDLLITKGEEANGLWYVSVGLKEYDKDAFEAATIYKANKTTSSQILFAIKVQEAISNYDISFGYTDFSPSGFLNLTVGGIEPTNSIENINNRPYNSWTLSTKASSDYGLYKEMQWSNINKPDVAAITKGDKKNVLINPDDASFDMRGNRPVYKAVLGEWIPVYAYQYFYSGKAVANEKIAAMYITFDMEENAVESKPSEWNAWKSYENDILGLNLVQPGAMAAIQINSKAADGDVIGFRVYAVNVDGTLVDPDGRAFYVQVGKPSSELTGINTVMNTIEQFKTFKSGVTKADIQKLNIASWSFKMTGELATGDDVEGVFYLAGAKGDGTDDIIMAAATGDFGYASIDLNTIKTAYFIPTFDYESDAEVDLWAYVDDYTYEGEFTFYNADGFVVATLPVSFTKTLPASIAQVPVKTSQLGADGKYRCFLVPANWQAYADVASAEKGVDGVKGTADDQKGTIDMLSIFNFPKDDPKGYEITFANATKTLKDSKLVAANVTVKPKQDLATDTKLNITTGPDNQLEVTYLDLIDNKTEHKTTVVYNMGMVSSKLLAYTNSGLIDLTKSKDYILDAGTFQTIFFCIYNDDANYGWPWSWDSSAAWANTDAIAGSAKITKGKNLFSVVYEDYSGGKLPASKVIGGSKWDSLYKGAMPTGYNNSINVTDVKLVTKGGANDGKVEYYDVKVNGTDFEFTKKSGATNPTSAVPSELVITYTDMYGHENVCKVDRKRHV